MKMVGAWGLEPQTSAVWTVGVRPLLATFPKSLRQNEPACRGMKIRSVPLLARDLNCSRKVTLILC